MKYQVEVDLERYIVDMKDKADIEDAEKAEDVNVEKMEYAGVIHLVQGWTQQGHVNQVSEQLLVF